MQSKQWALALGLLIASLPSAATAAQDETPVKVDPLDELAAIQEEFEEERQAFFKIYADATPEEREELTFPEPLPYIERARLLAETHSGQAAAAQACAWIVNMGPSDHKEWALATLLTNHIASEAIGEVCGSLAYDRSDEAGQALRDIREQNPHHAVKGQATFSLARYLMRNGDSTDEPIALFEEVAADYPDLEHWSGTLGEGATSNLFELRNLQIGMKAPDIEGNDLDGVPFRLSDYTGKVIVLDFWGNW